jgi:stage II sporulation protein D
MRRNLRLCLFLGLLLLAFLVNALTAFPGRAASIPDIRVCLARGRTVAFQIYQGNYRFTDEASGQEIGSPVPGEQWTITKEGSVFKIARGGETLPQNFTGPLTLLPADQKETGIFYFNQNRYRGSLKLYGEDELILAVNVLGMESYLYGVVGQEMGYAAPLEALKAQAVVSRSYAVSSYNQKGLYDVGTDIYTQVYGGYDAELFTGGEQVRQAVDTTAGQVIYYDHQVIRAFFHANAGGYTENSENVWSEALPYLKAISSPADAYALQAGSEWAASSYQWTKTFSREELLAQLADWNSKTTGTNMVQVGDILELRPFKWIRNSISEETKSGRVTQLDMVGTGGTKSFYRDQIRSVLGLKSTLFDLKLDSTVAILNAAGEKVIKSRGTELMGLQDGGYPVPVNTGQADYTVAGANAVRKIPKVFNKVAIDGRGNGHGLGMSQWGARGMAVAGYNYQQIIKHYYGQGKQDGSLSITTYQGLK